jgi:hypothetical protein
MLSNGQVRFTGSQEKNGTDVEVEAAVTTLHRDAAEVARAVERARARCSSRRRRRAGRSRHR